MKYYIKYLAKRLLIQYALITTILCLLAIKHIKLHDKEDVKYNAIMLSKRFLTDRKDESLYLRQIRNEMPKMW